MKKSAILLIIIFALISINLVFANDVNETTFEHTCDDVEISVNQQEEVYEQTVSDSYNNLSVANDNGNSAENSIKSSDVAKYYSTNNIYTAYFSDNHGFALDKTTVTVKISNVKTYSQKTDSNGKLSLKINLKPGTYKITATNPATGYQLTTVYKILPTIQSEDITKVYTDNHKFTAEFLKSNGKVLANTYIKFKLKGKTYKVKTNKKGVATLSVSNLKVGTHKIISINKDSYSKTNYIKVVKSSKTSLTSKDYTFLIKDKKTVSVKLLDKYGYTPSKGKIIKIQINGKKYSVKTDNNGIAKLKLPALKKGVYKIKYSFAGTKFYKKSSSSYHVTVIPSKNPSFSVESTKTFGYGAGTPFQVALKVGGVPLSKRTITFSVDGKTYKKTTNTKGIASLPINLNVGEYTVKYTNKKESKVNTKTGSTTIHVIERLSTQIAWKSPTSFSNGHQSFKIQLKDENNQELGGKTVKLTIGSNTYSQTTTSNGYATFNLKMLPGSYSVKYSSVGDNYYKASSGNVNIDVQIKNPSFGYYIWGADMKNVNLNKLASKGTKDIFLNYYAISLHGKTGVEDWISQANNLGLRVHIWQQVFYRGTWHHPDQVDDEYITNEVNKAISYAKIKGVSGVHFDYLRFPSQSSNSKGIANINNFVKKATDEIHKINSNLIVSATLMPETTGNAYGQQYSTLSKYLDVVIPLVYKGNGDLSSKQMLNIVKWFVDNSKGATVWAGLQGYHSDNDLKKLTTDELSGDVSNVINEGASGAIIFRYTLTNLPDFTSFTTKTTSTTTDTSGSSLDNSGTDGSGSGSGSSNGTDSGAGGSGSGSGSTNGTDVGGGNGSATNGTSTINSTNSTSGDNTNNSEVNGSNTSTTGVNIESLSDMLTSSSNIYNHIIRTNAIPATITVGKHSYTTAQYLYLLTKTLENIITGDVSKISVINASEPSDSVSIMDTGSIYESEYIHIAFNIINFMDKNFIAPRYANSSLGTIGYSDLIYMFSAILNYYNNNHQLPKYVSMNNEKITYLENNSISVSDIILGANNLQNLIKIRKLSTEITVGDKSFSLPEFLYLMSQAIYQIKNGNLNPITCIFDVKLPDKPYGGDDINDKTSYKYQDVALRVANYIKINGKAPNYARSDVGNIHYVELLDTFSRILVYYNVNNKMPVCVGIYNIKIL